MTPLAPPSPLPGAASPPPRYERLARPYGKLGAVTSLWKAGDHLLLVSATGIQERYQRFEFSDIKGFLVEPSSQALILSLCWGGLLLLALMTGLLLGALASPGIAILIIVFMAVILIPSGIFVWTTARTRRVFIVTRVQTTLLPPLTTDRRVRRFFARVGPLIMAAQEKAGGVTG